MVQVGFYCASGRKKNGVLLFVPQSEVKSGLLASKHMNSIGATLARCCLLLDFNDVTIGCTFMCLCFDFEGVARFKN